MLTAVKPLRRRLAFETLAFTACALGAGTLLKSVLKDRHRSQAFRWALLSTVLAAPIFFYPRRTFARRNVVITGGSRGLGIALARRLLKQNANVTLLARNCDELEAAKKLLIEQVPGCEHRIFIHPTDVTECEHLDTAFAEARARFGQIDVLINNAGAIVVGPFASHTSDDFKALTDLHLHAVVLATRLIQPYLRQAGGGHIVNISSLGGVMPVPHMTAYTASKFALGGFSEAVGAELRQDNILVTTVYPGLLRTGSPIQAIFKGDVAKEYGWFAPGDETPLLSVSADCAAARILKAAADGQARFILTAPAKIGSFVHAVFPEIFLSVMELVARAMPKSTSRETAIGAQARERLASDGVVLPTEALQKKLEERNNEHANFNVSLHHH